MKTVPVGLVPLVGTGRVPTPSNFGTNWSLCVLITRTDGTKYAFTDHDKSITGVSAFPGQVFTPALSFVRSNIRGNSDTKTDDYDFNGVLDSATITESDLDAGKFNDATMQSFWVDWTNPGSGIIKLPGSSIGQVKRGQYNFKATVKGLTQFLQTETSQFYSGSCRATFGDSRCTVNKAALAQAGIVTGVTDGRTFTASGLTGAAPRTISYTSNKIYFLSNLRILDGNNGFITAGFRPNDAIQISGSEDNDAQHTIATVYPAGATVNGTTIPNDEIVVVSPGIVTDPAGPTTTVACRTMGYFDLGIVTWTSGLNNGLSGEVRTWDGTSQIVMLFNAPFAIQVGDHFSITPGCDKRIQTCFAKYNNIIHFRGEPFVPGQDALYVYPNAG